MQLHLDEIATKVTPGAWFRSAPAGGHQMLAIAKF
jgi:hypothetical protein